MSGGVPGTRLRTTGQHLDRAWGDFAASGCVEVREDGHSLAELATLPCEVNRKGKLETVVLEDPTKREAQLDPRHCYSQVPALAAGDRGVLDLLRNYAQRPA
jgi:hypothetical protein